MANKTLYVGNLPFSTTETQLTSHFSSYGATNARVVEGRGFGFVDIDANQFEAAVADNHNKQMDGRTITVNEARPREPRSDSGSYGSRSGGSGGGSSSGKPRTNRW